MTAPDHRGNVEFLLHRGHRPYMALSNRPDQTRSTVALPPIAEGHGTDREPGEVTSKTETGCGETRVHPAASTYDVYVQR
jgi:hypothetical protein